MIASEFGQANKQGQYIKIINGQMMNKDKRYRDRMNSKGMYEVRGIWAPKEHHERIKNSISEYIDNGYSNVRLEINADGIARFIWDNTTNKEEQ